MVAMPSNWTAVFKDAAGDSVYTTGGYESPMTMDIKTGDTFVNHALVNMATDEIRGKMLQGVNLNFGWDSITVNAPEFGISDFEKLKADLTQADFDHAENVAHQPSGPQLM